MEKSGECKGNLRSTQKVFRVMKMMCFLMFVLLMQVRGDVVAQNQLVSIDLKNCNVEEFLREVKNQTGIRFMYKSEYVQAIPRFDVQVKKREVMDLLNEIFADKGITCLYDAGVIILQKMQKDEKPEKLTVKGIVKDERGHVLPGVTVLIKGTSVGVATDAKGEFTLETVKQDSLTLLFSFIGMKTKEVRWTGQKNVEYRFGRRHAGYRRGRYHGISDRQPTRIGKCRFDHQSKRYHGTGSRVYRPDVARAYSGHDGIEYFRGAECHAENQDSG